MIKLTVTHDSLSIGEDMLLYFYPAGDCDRCPWPADYKDPDLYTRLTGALFDAREVGELPDECYQVELPDASIFTF